MLSGRSANGRVIDDDGMKAAMDYCDSVDVLECSVAPIVSFVIAASDRDHQ
jgi:hypothetical protein